LVAAWVDFPFFMRQGHGEDKGCVRIGWTAEQSRCIWLSSGSSFLRSS
jgi:hypothetical protein